MDKILFNGVIKSIDNKCTVYEAIGIEDGRIQFLGTNEEALKISAKEKIDLNGRLVLPGFMDTHVHMLYYSILKDNIDLRDCTSVEDIIEKGKEFAESNVPSRGWLLGTGWNQNNFITEKRLLTKEDLDKVSTEYPVIYSRVCEHTAAVNSLGLEKILSMPETKDMESYIDKEAGILYESACMLPSKIMGEVSTEAAKEYLVKGIEDLNKCGITTIHSADFLGLQANRWQEVLRIFQELEAEGRLNVRIYEQCMFLDKENMNDFFNCNYKTGDGSSMVKIGPLKLILDGSLGGRTAAMKEPYTDDPTTKGLLNFEYEELLGIVDRAYDQGLQLAIHGIGDKAIEMIIDAYEAMDKKYPVKDRRNGIVHAQFTNKELLRRMNEGNVLALIQPIFIDDDMKVAEQRVGKERMESVYAWKTMRNMGIHTAGGSDAPVASFDVLKNIHCAVNSQDLKSQPEGGWQPQERLTVEEAVRLFTIDSAYASFDEKEKGSLEIGKYADMVVLDKNIYEINSDEIIDTKVEITILNGNIVYEK